MHVWVEAARPRTLPVAVGPVLVGLGAAGVWDTWRFAGALVVALALQVAVNYANDYFDGTRGVDTPERVGPRRAVAAGLVAPDRMKTAIAVAVGVAVLAGIGLTLVVGPELLLVGLASIAALLAYSGGPRPYASAGLGELFVFVFFGPVATVGTTYVLAEHVTLLAVAASIPVGLLAAGVLVVNNLRDVETDAAAGKRTLAVRLGPKSTRRLLVCLVGLAAVVAVAIAFTEGGARQALVLVGPVCLAVVVVDNARRAEGAALVKQLPVLAATHLLLSIALAVVLWA